MNKLKTMKSSESVEQQKLFAWAEIARMIPEYKGIELMYHIYLTREREVITPVVK